MTYAAVTLLAKTEQVVSSFALALGKIAVLQFVYPLTAVLVDWCVHGRTLSFVQLAGVVLMALALWTIRKPRQKVGGIE